MWTRRLALPWREYSSMTSPSGGSNQAIDRHRRSRDASPPQIRQRSQAALRTPARSALPLATAQRSQSASRLPLLPASVSVGGGTRGSSRIKSKEGASACRLLAKDSPREIRGLNASRSAGISPHLPLGAHLRSIKGSANSTFSRQSSHGTASSSTEQTQGINVANSTLLRQTSYGSVSSATVEESEVLAVSRYKDEMRERRQEQGPGLHLEEVSRQSNACLPLRPIKSEVKATSTQHSNDAPSQQETNMNVQPLPLQISQFDTSLTAVKIQEAQSVNAICKDEGSSACNSTCRDFERSRSADLPHKGPSLKSLDRNGYWAQVRQQTRTSQLEEAISRRGSKGTWELEPGEGSDWQHIRNQSYECTVPFSVTCGALLITADECILALSNKFAGHHGWNGVRVLDIGCGVGSFLSRLRYDALDIDWSASFGVTSVHPSDINCIQPPPGDPNFFDSHIMRFDLDTLADSAEQHLGGYSFDFVTSHFCFCHLKDPLGALCVAFEMLRPSGILLLIEPFREQTVALPYTDQQYYYVLRDDEQVEPLRLHLDLAPCWSAAGVDVFSSCQTSPPFSHVLVLRRRNPTARLELPAQLRSGRSVISQPESAASLRRARTEDLRQPFIMPPARNFKAWLNG